MLATLEDKKELTINNLSESINNLVLTDIYKEDINIAIWRRRLHDELFALSNSNLNLSSHFSSISIVAQPENVYQSLSDKLPEFSFKNCLIEDISLLTDMFCYLFNLKQAGIRLAILDKAMCPRFHVDRVPCRLITTYKGVGTQWLNNCDVDRNILGSVDYPFIDQKYQKIEELNVGDVALLKGESWIGNERRGLVHRSPDINQDELRLLLTIDFA
ncbi:MAG: DUF1826 domain-containing protein [Candidatus Lariskella arthropodorum]